MTIVSITPIDRRRCKVLLDEDFAFILYKGEIKKFKLEEGAQLTRSSYQRILNEVLYKRALERTLNLLKVSDKTEKQLRTKLEEGGYPQEAIDYAIEVVKEHHFLDDLKYAERYVEYYALHKNRRQLDYDLYRRGIDRDIVAAVLDGTEIDEDWQILSLLRKRGYKRREDSSEERDESVEEARERRQKELKEYQKTAAFLARKGFSWEAIRRVMGEMGKEDNEFL